ncbi:inverse autotransporter beta domain-containing protein [Litorivicinus sp.]|nr:inverse autotransporter beta domain-containing protein [Litorivicinus sp.]
MKLTQANYVIYLVILLITAFIPRFVMSAVHGDVVSVDATDGNAASSSSSSNSQGLSIDFFNSFKRVGDLKNPAIRDYFSDFPAQIPAFRGYTNSLVNAALISESEADRMMRAAVASGAPTPKANSGSMLPNSVNTNVPENDQKKTLSDSDLSYGERIALADLRKKEREQTKYFFDVVNSLEPTSRQTEQNLPATYRETRAIAMQLDVFLPLELLRAQKRSLSPGFGNKFRSVESFKSEEFRKFFQSHPDEIWAVREYFQQLVDIELLSQRDAIESVALAFQAASEGISNDQIIQAKTVSLVQMRRSADVVDLPDGVLSGVVSGYLKNEGRPELIEFGVVPELPGSDGDSAAAAIKTLEQHERRRKLALTATKIMRAFAANNVPRSEVGRKIAEIMQSEVEQKVTTEVNEVVNEAVDQVTERFFDSGRASVDAFTSRGPSYEVSGLKSFESSDADPVFTFGQIGARYGDSEATLNLGVGVRAIDPTQMVMAGVNVFYDREFPRGHERASIGAEIISSSLRFNANRYYALSGAKVIDSNTSEKALGGRDTKLKLAVPYLPGLFASYRDFKWYGNADDTDLFGSTLGLSGHVSNNLSVQFARTDYGSDHKSSNSASLTYNYVPGSQDRPRFFELSAVPWQLTPISPRERYQMVEREDEIVKEVSDTSAGTLIVTFTSI